MPKFIDKTGMTFGQLTVLSKAKNKNGYIYWNCKCSCGKEICIRGDKLTQSHVDDKGNPSCGCLRIKHVVNSTSKNLLNKKFGKLTVIEKTNERSSNGCIIWKCKCDCGNIVKLPTDYLNKENGTKSCGCLQKEIASNFLKDLHLNSSLKIGDCIKNFVILDIELRPTNNGHNETWIYSKCPFCENKKWFQLRYIKNEDTKSCGCISKSAGEKKIEQILINNNIPFQREFYFKDCRNQLPLLFDFYINNNYLIEYDGEQHFNKSNKWYSEEGKKRDKIKNKYCLKNNIPLIRIPYTHYNKLCLEDLLLETSTFIINAGG